MNLNGKKILFIGPRYFNYGIKIKEELERNGANVIWINSNIRDSNIYNSFVYKYLPAYSDKLRNRYYKKRLHNEVIFMKTIIVHLLLLNNVQSY